jgi:Family of unknown function (DUF5681)
MAKYSKSTSSNVLKMHEFKPGQCGNARGRPRGKPNKHAHRMRDAMKRAMALVGDENGKGGYVGFLARVARQWPLEFLQEAVKLEPKVLAAAIDESFNEKIKYTSSDEARAALEWDLSRCEAGADR